MYLSFYGLNHPPFGVLPPSQPIYLAEAHREALATVIYGILARKPIFLLTGDVGLGKSTILRAALERVAQEALRVVEIPHPVLTPVDVLRLLGAALGIAGATRLELADIETVHRAMRDIADAGGRVLLVIDEAQALPPETLEFIRLMSNLEAGARGHFQILLVGQPELLRTLNRHRFRALRQRIAIRSELKSLSSAEAEDYIRFRVELAGGTVEPLFTAGALRNLARRGRGIPRRINAIADNALLLSFGNGVRQLDSNAVRRGAAALDGSAGRLRQLAAMTPLRWAALAVFAVLGIALAIPGPQPQVPAPVTRAETPQALPAPAAVTPAHFQYSTRLLSAAPDAAAAAAGDTKAPPDSVQPGDEAPPDESRCRPLAQGDGFCDPQSSIPPTIPNPPITGQPAPPGTAPGVSR